MFTCTNGSFFRTSLQTFVGSEVVDADAASPVAGLRLTSSDPVKSFSEWPIELEIDADRDLDEGIGAACSGAGCPSRLGQLGAGGVGSAE